MRWKAIGELGAEEYIQYMRVLIGPAWLLYLEQTEDEQGQSRGTVAI